MADPLRRTLSKLRAKRAKKGPPGGLQPNGEGPPCGGKTVTAEDSRLASDVTQGWSFQNHNNNNYSNTSKWDATSGPSPPAQPALGCRYSQYSNISDSDLMPNGLETECSFNSHPLSCAVNGKDVYMGRYSYGGFHNRPVAQLQPPNSAPYTVNTCFDGQWPPHHAPFPPYPQNLMYPKSETRLPQDFHAGVGRFAPMPWSPDTFQGSGGFATNCHIPPLGLVGAPYYGTTRNHSEDSEEDDYYDNEQLLITATSEGRCNSFFPGPEVASPQTPMMTSAVTSPVAGYGHQERKSNLDMYLETDRLRSQLQEAYYLLIHAMHDMPLETNSSKIGSRLETCPSSSQSQDSVYSQSSARVVESDVWSSDEASPNQASRSDLVSLNALISPQLNRMQTFSKSVDAVHNLPTFRALHKCHSDSQIKYSPINSSSSSDCGFEYSQGSIGQHTDADSEGSPRELASSVNWRALQSGTDGYSGYMHPAPGASLTGSAGGHGVGMSAEGHSVSQKPPGLAVKKMQKWMYKGRLLSLEVKERIIGSSQKTGGPNKREASPTGSCKSEHLQDSSAATFSKLPGEMERPPATDFIENSYTSSVIKRDLKVTEVNEHNLQRNHITVSKKRNWLTQSTQRYENKAIFQTSIFYTIASKDPEVHLCRTDRDVSLKSPETDTVPTTPASPSAMPATDLSEENDADDEGEIWYNPIPEDDDAFVCPAQPSSRTVSDPGHEAVEATRKAGGILSTADPLQVPLSSENNVGDSSHSMDYSVQLCKQRAVCKSSEDAPVYRTHDHGPAVCSIQKSHSMSPADFSPPCSPNPSKKGGSINWSLPDKIKSPRTVRKLSMKMKKLPELSRKLSVKGTSSHANSDPSSSTSKGNCQDVSHAQSLSSSRSAASRNVISRYHLDSSVSSQQSYKKKSSGTSKSSSKGGYLSDGDSPELITKSGKHGGENRSTKGKESLPSNNTKVEMDIDAFRHYSFSDQPKCFQYVSGLMSLHFYGAEDLKPPRIDSKDVFCAIQVDSVNKARTALLTCRTSFLDMDHTFNIELENAQHLKLVVFSWDPTPKRNRVCCHGTVVLPTLFRVTKTHQLAVKLEPRGLIYVKLTLMEQWENSSDRLGVDRDPVVFGVDAHLVVEKENTGSMVPLLMEKCILEIEKRGCQVVGLYRLCGSAAVKKELREAFERDSKSVGLCENEYPDINVITGVLKDYLRELPSPLITKQLYEAVLHAMAEKPLKMSGNGCDNDPRDSEHTVELLSCLPDVERATLKMLLDHLKLVASYHEVNKMTCQNLAVCFGPVLLSQRQETSNHNNRVFIDSEELASALDFKKHIEVLHYLLQLWPVKSERSKDPTPESPRAEPQPCLRRKKPRPQMLNLNGSEISGVLRPRAARLDSPSSNRYAGDWSSCQGNYLPTPKEEADYADVPPASPLPRDTCVVRVEETNQHFTAKEAQAVFALSVSAGGGPEEPDVNLQDLQESIDTLIGNLERELSKNRLNVTV
ncbi:rho GTPase-activating protein SYDE2 isoform X2 [Hyperolius riggenbachi]|uniref:rho GTPase-activating protein SYDE2 isoform X2 n=1 Tax=Hyperolius riggenbachi TaxID=752182 RepID=UPI0035A3D3F6